MSKVGQNVVLIDAEYSAYGLRAHDIGLYEGILSNVRNKPFKIELYCAVRVWVYCDERKRWVDRENGCLSEGLVCLSDRLSDVTYMW